RNQFMTYRIVSASARTVGKIVGRSLAIAAAATALAVIAPCGTFAQPQKPAPKAAPKAAPAPAPQPQAQQPAPQQQAAEPLQLIYGPWVKFCGNDPTDKKRVCATVKDGREESGRLVVAVAIFEKD